MSEIKIFHIAGGRPIIGRHTGDEALSASLVISDPHDIVVQPGPQGQLGMNLIPSFVCYGALPTKKEIVIKRIHVLYTEPSVPKQLEDAFLSASSGIVLA